MKTTFKDILMELFDSNVNYTVTKEDAKRFSTRATINNRDIVFMATIDDSSRYGISADIEFWEVKEKRNDIELPAFGATGHGGERKVLSMVGASIKEMVARYEPDMISFTAEKEPARLFINGKGIDSTKRANIYEKLMKKFIPQYEIIKRDVGSSIVFKLLKK